jgi:hypothetical protein
MEKEDSSKNSQVKSPQCIFDEELEELQCPKIKLTKSTLDKAIKDGEGIFKIGKVYESVFSGGILKPAPQEMKQELLEFLEKIKGLYKTEYTEDEIKSIYATGVIGASNPRLAEISVNDTFKTWESTEKAYTLAYSFKISLLRKELEDALAKNDIYRACYCCTHICGLWHQLKMLPLNEPVRQMTARNMELRRKRRKIPASADDTKKIIGYYNNEKNTFEMKNKTSHGSSKHALNSTSEKFKLGLTSVKKILKTYNQNKPDPDVKLFEIT